MAAALATLRLCGGPWRGTSTTGVTDANTDSGMHSREHKTGQRTSVTQSQDVWRNASYLTTDDEDGSPQEPEVVEAGGRGRLFKAHHLIACQVREECVLSASSFPPDEGKRRGSTVFFEPLQRMVERVDHSEPRLCALPRRLFLHILLVFRLHLARSGLACNLEEELGRATADELPHAQARGGPRCPPLGLSIDGRRRRKERGGWYPQR